MTVLEQQPLTLSIPLYEDPPGVLRVGKSRVLLELVIHAFQRGETPEGIVQSFDTLSLPDVYAVVGYYLANPAAVDEYLRQCDRGLKEWVSGPHPAFAHGQLYVPCPAGA
jgi:uncharacterized protein (DUF433 family)